MPLVVDQVVDKLAGQQNTQASSAQTLLFPHEGMPDGIVIGVIDRCVVQARKIETVARIFYSTNECVPETRDDKALRRIYKEKFNIIYGLGFVNIICIAI